MLGYVLATGRGDADRVLSEVADRLTSLGWPLAGAVQLNIEHHPARPCHMDLHVLNGGARIRISQDLGPLSEGCRLDPSALEQAVGLVEAALDAGPRLLIVNKFGKQELDGRGFRPVIGRALSQNVPVLLAVSAGSLEGFVAFADGIGHALPADADAVLNWCLAQE